MKKIKTNVRAGSWGGGTNHPLHNKMKIKTNVRAGVGPKADVGPGMD